LELPGPYAAKGTCLMPNATIFGSGIQTWPSSGLARLHREQLLTSASIGSNFCVLVHSPSAEAPGQPRANGAPDASAPPDHYSAPGDSPGSYLCACPFPKRLPYLTLTFTQRQGTGSVLLTCQKDIKKQNRWFGEFTSDQALRDPAPQEGAVGVWNQLDRIPRKAPKFLVPAPTDSVHGESSELCKASSRTAGFCSLPSYPELSKLVSGPILLAIYS